MSQQFGPKITTKEYHQAMKRLDSIKAVLEPFEFYYEEFDILIDHKVGIYVHDTLRAELHASYRRFKERLNEIDQLFDKMDIDSEDYRWEFGQAVKTMVTEVNLISPVEIFSSSSYKLLLL